MTTVTSWYPGVVLGAADLSPEMIVAIKAALTDAQAAALTAWAEARCRLLPHIGWVANPTAAMANIVNVLLNRTRDGRPRWQGLTLRGVCLERWAFSCWEPTGGPDINHDPRHLADNFEALMTRAQQLLAGHEPSDKLRDCLALAEGAAAGTMPDSLHGATHYYAEWMPTPPSWSFADPSTRQQPLTPVAVEYGHRFYNGVK